MDSYLWFALGASLALALSALLGKVMLRYRICDAGLVTWGQGVAVAVISLVAAAVMRVPLPSGNWGLVVSMAVVLLIATRLLNWALQEGDASTVVPLLGLKIPIASVLSWLLLGERASAAVWLAVVASAGAVALFGVGRQEKAQGGHGHKPVIAVMLAVCVALFYSMADILAKVSASSMSTVTVVLWSNVLWGPVSALALMSKKYRMYRVQAVDYGMFTLGGAFVVGAMLSLYYAFSVADSVILPNVIMGTRGIFALVAAYALGKAMKVPMERQSGMVYLCRAIGTLLLLATLLLLRVSP